MSGWSKSQLREQVFERTDIDGRAKCVFCALLKHAGESFKCWPKLSTVSKHAGLPVSTVRAMVRCLETDGLVSTQDRRPTTPIYTLHPERLFDVAPFTAKVPVRKRPVKATCGITNVEESQGSTCTKPNVQHAPNQTLTCTIANVQHAPSPMSNEPSSLNPQHLTLNNEPKKKPPIVPLDGEPSGEDRQSAMFKPPKKKVESEPKRKKQKPLFPEEWKNRSDTTTLEDTWYRCRLPDFPHWTQFIDVWELYRKHRPTAKDLTATHLASFRLRLDRGYTLDEILQSVDFTCMDGYWASQATLTKILSPDQIEKAKRNKPQQQTGTHVNARGIMESTIDPQKMDSMMDFE